MAEEKKESSQEVKVFEDNVVTSKHTIRLKGKEIKLNTLSILARLY